jgi:hypothetical protein
LHQQEGVNSSPLLNRKHYFFGILQKICQWSASSFHDRLTVHQRDVGILTRSEKMHPKRKAKF